MTMAEARERWPDSAGLGSAWPIAVALTLGHAVTAEVDVGPPLGKAAVVIEVRSMGAAFVAYTDGEPTRCDDNAADMATWLGYLVDDGMQPNTGRGLRALLERCDAARNGANDE